MPGRMKSERYWSAVAAKREDFFIPLIWEEFFILTTGELYLFFDFKKF
ncbi:MAG: hypothetical protein UT14_C0025G0002 [Candidatus Shapirobacteria bacterium GW2011_GWE1_38_92]|uniref:Uncharacterized protein n=1 Tax=Candidatus Shapirobacteria bacterium GW2011_GWE1_38_92 TaxID=1618489 RepID=A0A0G0LGP7_9BACT|nr:MAG: hypothetical protein UT14_C0025G0002 [Candidatus Shapirobacteria bacterium GW2011_GWE1_38_92]